MTRPDSYGQNPWLLGDALCFNQRQVEGKMFTMLSRRQLGPTMSCSMIDCTLPSGRSCMMQRGLDTHGSRRSGRNGRLRGRSSWSIDVREKLSTSKSLSCKIPTFGITQRKQCRLSTENLLLKEQTRAERQPILKEGKKGPKHIYFRRSGRN